MGEQPAPEVLKPQTEASSDEPAAPAADAVADQHADGAQPAGSSAASAPAADAAPASGLAALKRPRHAYRPSHKATFIGLAVVALILAVNAGVIFFVIKRQSGNNSQAAQGQVTISQGVLDKLGVNRNTLGDEGVELTINPNTKFGGRVEIAKDVSIAGQLKLNGRFSASEASFARLEGGNTSLTQLNVNGDGTLTSLNLRRDLVVTGTSRLQGDVVLSRLLTVNNSANVAGNLAVGGTLSTAGFQSRNLTVENNLTIGGRIITRGSAPSVSPGTALGSNGTVSVSGSDTAGTVAANVGVGAAAGIVARVNFRSPYASTPRVVVTPVGAGVNGVYVVRSATGFSIGVNSAMGPGGYAFDFIVVQ